MTDLVGRVVPVLAPLEVAPVVEQPDALWIAVAGELDHRSLLQLPKFPIDELERLGVVNGDVEVLASESSNLGDRRHRAGVLEGLLAPRDRALDPPA